MFTNSGMMPFVPYFLGEEPVPSAAPGGVGAALRAGRGQAQRPRRHRALAAPPQLLRDAGQLQLRRLLQGRGHRLGLGVRHRGARLDPDRLVPSATDDDEAEALWADEVGFPAERIQRLGKENFWEMGETGPCGPSSEIFWDYGPESGPRAARPTRRPRTATSRSGTWCSRSTCGRRRQLSDLPSKNIDTGAGLERIMAVLAGSLSLYGSDTWRPWWTRRSR